MVDLVSLIVAGCEAWCLADRTVNVEHLPTTAANQVVVVIAHAVFIAGGRADRLNALEQACLDQSAKCVVDRLPRNRTDFIACHLCNFFSGGMWIVGDCSQYCDALGRDLDPMPAEGFSVVGQISLHILTLTRSVYLVKGLNVSNCLLRGFVSNLDTQGGIVTTS